MPPSASSGAAAASAVPPPSAHNSWWSAEPPIHVWMPNHPHATSARVSDGRLVPCVRLQEPGNPQGRSPQIFKAGARKPLRQEPGNPQGRSPGTLNAEAWKTFTQQLTRIPKDARASTGKGTPYFVPGCALSSIGSSVITLPINTVAMPCCHDMPRSTRLAANRKLRKPGMGGKGGAGVHARTRAAGVVASGCCLCSGTPRAVA
eukprot:354624-Chlamydomonas_euryale.AAC.1